MRRELGLPVGQLAPLRILEEALRRPVQRVGVDEAAAADARAGQDRDVACIGEIRRIPCSPSRGIHRYLRRSHVVRRELVVGEAPARLLHAHRVALLGQPQRRDAAAEARADDDPVPVEVAVHAQASEHTARPSLKAGSVGPCPVWPDYLIRLEVGLSVSPAVTFSWAPRVALISATPRPFVKASVFPTLRRARLTGRVSTPP